MVARSFLLLFIVTGNTMAIAQTDTSHYSEVFKRTRPYRIFLPEAYSTDSTKKYPVIYYFHGNKGDHRLDIEGVTELVNQSQVILVAWNGRSAPEDDRPYNIGYHANINYEVQFKDYFPELVNHIDKIYRTVSNRSQRALIGHSMGGFMSFYLAGKYPQMVGAAVSSRGSPEFFVGYPSNHTLYQHRYMFKNLYGIKTRFQNGTAGEELVHLNNEVHGGALRELNLNYSYQTYAGGHSISSAEFEDAFEFVVEAFQNPDSMPPRWHHADLYPEFEVWGYQVTSNLNTPGFIELHGVTKGGLTTLTRKWQPDGIPVPGVDMHIKTAPIYKPNTHYALLDYNNAEKVKKTSTIMSDKEGRINIAVNHQEHIFGIYENGGPAEIVFASYKVNNKRLFLDHNKRCALQLCLLNRGGSVGKKLKVVLSSTTPGVKIENPAVDAGKIESGEAIWINSSFNITAANIPPANGGSPYIRFNLAITDNNGNTWKDEFEALVMYDVPEFTEIGIDDGDSEIYGSGNGNNIAQPGETVMIYQYSHRTKLFYDDPYIDAERIHDDLQPDKWGDGYALSSLIHISEDCPPGHVIRFLACYEVKEWKTIKRNVTWGTFSIIAGEKLKKE